jgi:hypothetical protein
MLEALPTELQEKICSLLDGTSLLRASCVSKDWNRCVTTNFVMSEKYESVTSTEV